MTDSAPRLVTPPSRSMPANGLDLTPQQVKQFELNRLRAKAAQREKEASSSTSATTNSNNKRPLLARDRRLGTYIEYDLSKMANTKGGFLLQDDAEVDEDLVRRERQRERERMQQTLEPAVFLDRGKNPQCRECGSIDVDQTFRKKCQNEKPEKYSLLTKTECKEDYLLTDPELRDHEVMPHLLKANPHASTFANMMLFLRYQVEEFAFKKWGSPEALDAEWERRESEKKRKKNRKFEEGLRELRRRTKGTVWQRRRDEDHIHVYSPVRNGKQICTSCGFTLEVEEL
ncbi:XPA protein C-terminus-domain-containing protein [Schizophyllum amplum]|uniref:XPA protein C-terminus-domain-containing protein n=1 Tax=Schizophyllum amplum TaxID=97359 RepID=A0A550C5P3_9AGAR|nr:XPA protein C-terminus-domain-containing protein [Auriculariopsis ampla]